MDQPDFTTFRLSTADLPEKDRVATWRDYWCQVMMKLDIEPIKDTQLEYLILTRELPVRVMSTAMSPVRITRTREYLADGNGDLIFIINQTGKATTSARDPVFANCRSEKARHLIPSRAVLCSVRARLSVLSRESN